MTNINTFERTALSLLVTTAFLVGTTSLLSVATSPLFGLSSGDNGVLEYRSEPSVGGPAFAQGALHGAASAIPESHLAERVTLGILLIILGYALHAAVVARDKRIAVRNKRSHR